MWTQLFKKYFWYTAALSLLFFTYLMFRIIWPYSSGALDIDFLLTKQFYIHLAHYRWAFYLHIFSSLFILAAGLSQFSTKLLKSVPFIHRWIGKGYVLAVLLISAPAALLMALYANGGLFAKTSFALLSLLWWLFTYLGFTTIKKGQVLPHRKFMIRSYALALSAITLRFIQFLVSQYTHWDYELFYSYNAWISWIINLGIAEIYIWLVIEKQGVYKLT